MKFAIIVKGKHKGYDQTFSGNSGVNCGDDEQGARAKFAEFIAANKVKAKLIRVRVEDGADGEVLAESGYSETMVF
jgi:hypothetical protein